MKRFDRNLAKFSAGAVLGLALGLAHNAQAAPIQDCYFETQAVAMFAKAGTTDRATIMAAIDKAKATDTNPLTIVDMRLHLEKVVDFFDNGPRMGDYDQVASEYFNQCKKGA